MKLTEKFGDFHYEGTMRNLKFKMAHLLIATFCLSFTFAAYAQQAVKCSKADPSLCPVDGGWGEWVNTTKCHALSGQQRQERACTSPAPSNGGKACVGPKVQQAKCTVNGGWSRWSTDSICDASGLQLQKRTCTNPAPLNGGAACSGPDVRSMACAVNGGWSAWENSGTCDASGSQLQKRTCTNPSPLNGGALCAGPDTQSVTCKPKIDGGWTPWSKAGECGMIIPEKQMELRYCTNPAPSNGGAACVGLDYQYVSCAPLILKINGGWSAWENSGTCSLAGTQTQKRSCTNPAPSNGGAPCSGSDTQSVTCAVNGAWSTWADSGTCDGSGLKLQKRSCTNPAPLNGGAACLGSDTQSVACAVNGGWSAWADSGTCDGSGLKLQKRSCTNPAPLNGGAACSGSDTQSVSCSGKIDGAWSAWEKAGECGMLSKGSQMETRTCTNPAPKNGGAACVGLDYRFVSCFADGGWTSWINVGQCNVVTGIITQTRSCTNPMPANGGANCVGADTQQVACNGGWSAWISEGQCNPLSRKIFQSRVCNNPFPIRGGLSCVGPESQLVDCVPLLGAESKCKDPDFCVLSKMPLLAQNSSLLAVGIRDLSGITSIQSDAGWCGAVASTMALAGEKLEASPTVNHHPEINQVLQIPEFQDSHSRTGAYAPVVYAVGQRMQTDWIWGGTSTYAIQSAFNFYHDAISNMTSKGSGGEQYITTQKTNQYFINMFQLNKGAFQVTFGAFDATGYPRGAHALVLNGYEEGHLKIYDPWNRVYNVDLGVSSNPAFGKRPTVNFVSGGAGYVSEYSKNYTMGFLTYSYLFSN